MAHPPVPMRQIAIRVSEKVFAKIEMMAKDAGMMPGPYAGLLFDAAYAARMKGTPDAELDAHVALVGLATMAKKDLAGIAEAAGLSIETVNRMRDGWKAVLQERRRGH